VNHNLARAARQEVSIPLARNHGEGWSPSDVAVVAEAPAITVDLAEALGRTEYALQNVRQLLRNGGHVGSSRVAPVRPLSERVYTFIGDDVPPGWND
jgi:hypothetical protein